MCFKDARWCKCFQKLVFVTFFITVMLMVVLVFEYRSKSAKKSGSFSIYPNLEFNFSKLDLSFLTPVKVQTKAESKKIRPIRAMFPLPEMIPYGSEYYQYPLLVDMVELVRRVKAGENLTVKPINDPKFPYLINRNICEISKDFVPVDMLILIKSNPYNIISREVIRSTWGRLNCWGSRNVKKVFLLGKRPDNETYTLKQIAMENAVYRDIIQSDFIDHYYNNTYKMMLGISWAVEFCWNAKFIMFVDDDYFVHPRAALTFVESIGTTLYQKLVSGYTWQRAYPLRVQDGKWFTSPYDYPWPIYPPYCSAGNFFLSMPVAIDLNIAMKYTRYFRFDDVFLGIILYKMLMVPMHMTSVYSFNPIERNSSNYHKMVSSHGYKMSKKILESWIDLDCESFCSKQSI